MRLDRATVCLPMRSRRVAQAFYSALGFVAVRDEPLANEGVELRGHHACRRARCCIYQVISECETQVPSPAGDLVLRVDPTGRMEVARAHGAEELSAGTLQAPAMISWSPRGGAFFVSDGEGSGMCSTLRLFRVVDGRVVENRQVESKVVTRYRSAKRCAREAADPCVWGLGWSSDGTILYGLVQASIDQPSRSGRRLGSQWCPVVRE